jgi:hypothetical protein
MGHAAITYYDCAFRFLRHTYGYASVAQRWCESLALCDSPSRTAIEDEHDVIMPGLNGVETGIRLREIVPNCKIILFSGQAATVDLLEKSPPPGPSPRHSSQAHEARTIDHRDPRRFPQSRVISWQARAGLINLGWHVFTLVWSRIWLGRKDSNLHRPH